MPRIKIAYLIDTIKFDTAGTQKQLLQTIKKLDRQYFHPYLICLHSSKWLESNRLPCDLFVLNFTGFLKINFVKVLHKFISLLRDHRFDILQTFFEDSIFVGYLAAKFSFTTPVLISSRRDIGLGADRPWYHRLYRVVLPFVNMGFNGIIANSKNVKIYVSKNEKTSLNKIQVIYNGIKLPGNSISEPVVFNKVSTDFFIGIVASLTPIKRIDVFLKAIALFRDKKKNANFRAYILGEGPEGDRLSKLAEKLSLNSLVFFTGAVKNVYDYLHKFDVGVLCSDKEGLSNAILEYMACSLPVIATSAGGNSELVDRSNGFIVPPNDPEVIAEALLKLYENPELRHKLGHNSLKKIQGNYSWEKSISDHQNYYKSLLIAAGRDFNAY